tara:strand:- start:766 stop:1182 length:417 start_codon:yes stop_codon:yes gene_type:complete
MINRFHLAFPVNDLKSAKLFYTKVLGCKVGRESSKWVDFNLFGHQIVAHYSPKDCTPLNHNLVDGDKIPARHFGVVLIWNEWENLFQSIKKQKIDFYIKPKIRFKGQIGEQGTFFILDPSENVLEFKSFKDDSMIFRK